VRVAAGAVGVLLCAWPLRADAYRPFDGTDADVAELHELELELGPVGYYRIGHVHDFVSGGVINFGFLPRFELVLQGFDYYPVDSAGTTPNKFAATGVFVKTVWKNGCLQEKEGPSFATEIGANLPTVHDGSSFGAYVGAILSTCMGESLIVHWNVEVQSLPTSDFDLFAGAIFEPPPSKYVVRPVVELFVEHDFAGVAGIQTYSGLAGAIWQVSHKLALDVAIREASIGGQAVSEVRSGFSWAIP
jgi:hypothetical protein